MPGSRNSEIYTGNLLKVTLTIETVTRNNNIQASLAKRNFKWWYLRTKYVQSVRFITVNRPKHSTVEKMNEKLSGLFSIYLEMFIEF